jgi:hypothetical protein
MVKGADGFFKAKLFLTSFKKILKENINILEKIKNMQISQFNITKII